jgi:hypothetical protein
MSEPLIEILYLDGCPNHPAAVELVERVGDLGVKLEVRLTQVPDAEAARRQRFLGSPTVRVNGRDVEPGAEQRTDYVYACRVYRTESGFSGQPDEFRIPDCPLTADAIVQHLLTFLAQH